MRPQNQYFLLVLLRVFVALAAWGVVHPDELFQSVEVRVLSPSARQHARDG